MHAKSMPNPFPNPFDMHTLRHFQAFLKMPATGIPNGI
jgi:hypothetical protein